MNIYGAPGDILHPETAVQLLPSEIIPEKKNARLRILLAEDNKINQQYATLVLNKAGCQVTVVENGRKAVEAVRSAEFDLVLMDIQMPEMGGVEATRQIRNLPSPKNAVPIFAMTAHAMRGACEEYISAGMNDYITKPFQPALLLTKLENLVSAAEVGVLYVPASPNAALLDIPHLDELSAALPKESVAGLITLFFHDAACRMIEIDAREKAGGLVGIGGQMHMLGALPAIWELPAQVILRARSKDFAISETHQSSWNCSPNLGYRVRSLAMPSPIGGMRDFPKPRSVPKAVN